MRKGPTNKGVGPIKDWIFATVQRLGQNAACDGVEFGHHGGVSFVGRGENGELQSAVAAMIAWGAFGAEQGGQAADEILRLGAVALQGGDHLRHIHGTVVTIFTTAVTETGRGYLSHTYTSQYADPATGEARGGRSSFKDTFVPLSDNGPWVLQERVIDTEAHGDQPAGSQTFRFENLEAL